MYFAPPYFLGGQDTLIITVLAHLLKCLLIHIGSDVLNKSKFHYIYSFNPNLERQRIGFQESGTKEDGILLVWNSMYIIGYSKENLKIQLSLLSLRMFSIVCCPVLALTSAFVILSFQDMPSILAAINGEQHPVFLLLSMAILQHFTGELRKLSLRTTLSSNIVVPPDLSFYQMLLLLFPMDCVRHSTFLMAVNVMQFIFSP